MTLRHGSRRAGGLLADFLRSQLRRIGLGLPGAARYLIDKQDLGKFFYVANGGKADSNIPIGSVIVKGENATLFIGAVEFETSVRVSPLIYRDAAYWRDINVMYRFLSKEWIDLARPEFEYRGRYFETPCPTFLVFVYRAGAQPREVFPRRRRKGVSIWLTPSIEKASVS
jgi:hypothetical protein